MHYKYGFTLIEILIVISLFTLLATLGVMQLSFLDDTIAHAEVTKLATICSYLQQRAMTTNNEHILICDVQNNKYHCNTLVHEKLSQRITFGFLPNVLGSPGSPSHTIKKAITFPDSSIHFYPTGIISSGTMYLTNKTKTIMYAISNKISQVSRLRLYRYEGIWKLLSAITLS
ncbi:MAG TPA: type II secretion system protein [Candidatus Babeliales bacterium]|nr:type II secretion system protein [Candidatus Babeliales bacterium]